MECGSNGMLSLRKAKKLGNVRTYNGTLSCVRVTIVGVVKQYV